MRAADVIDDCDAMSDNDDNYLLNLLIPGQLILEKVVSQIPSGIADFINASKLISIVVGIDGVTLRIDKFVCRVGREELDFCWSTGVYGVSIKKRHLDLKKILQGGRPLGVDLIAGRGGIPLVEKLFTGNFSLIICVCINRKLHVLISLGDAFSGDDQRYDLTPYIKKYKLAMDERGHRNVSDRKEKAIPKILQPVRDEQKLPSLLQQKVALLRKDSILQIFIDGRYLMDTLAAWWQGLKGRDEITITFDSHYVIFWSPLSMRRLRIAEIAWYWNENVSSIKLNSRCIDVDAIRAQLEDDCFKAPLRRGYFELELSVGSNRPLAVNLHFAVPGTQTYCQPIPIGMDHFITTLSEGDGGYRSTEDRDSRRETQLLSYIDQVLARSKSQHLIEGVEHPIIKPVEPKEMNPPSYEAAVGGYGHSHEDLPPLDHDAAARALDFALLYPERPLPNIAAMLARAEPSNHGNAVISGNLHEVQQPAAEVVYPGVAYLQRSQHPPLKLMEESSRRKEDDQRRDNDNNHPFANLRASEDDFRWLEEKARIPQAPVKRVEMFPDPKAPVARAEPPVPKEELKAAEPAKKTVLNGITMPDMPQHPEKSAVAGELECKHCLDRKLATINNCGCLFFCITCSYEYVAKKTTCPMCQAPLRKIKRCFI